LLKAKDLTFKAKDSKYVLEDISRPRTTILLITASKVVKTVVYQNR